MLTSTRTAVLAVLKADPSITGDDINRIKAAFDGKADKADAPTARPLVKRAEVCRLTGLCPISVDRYARMGALRRVYLGNSQRASGFDPASVDAFLAGRATMNGDTAETEMGA